MLQLASGDGALIIVGRWEDGSVALRVASDATLRRFYEQ